MSHTTATSDSEEEDLIEEVPPLNISLPIGQLSDQRARQIIQEQQGHIEKLRATNSQLRLAVAELKAKLAVANSGRRGRKPKVTPKADTLYSREVVRTSGKQYSVMVSPWAAPSLFGRYPDPDTPEPQSSARYQTVASFDAGSILVLHRFLRDAELCRLAVESLSFRDEFIDEVNAQRSSGLFKVRQKAGLIFHDLGFPPEIWEAPNAPLRRANEGLRALLAPPADAGDAITGSALFASIFFPGRKYNMALLFFNDYQPKILRFLLFSSVNFDEKLVFRGKPIGKLWGITQLNTAAIVLSAIFLLFLLSGDSDLRPTGDHSNIKYWDNFKHYMELIDTNPSWAAALMKFFHDRVFNGHPEHPGLKAVTISNDTQAMNQAMLDLSVVDTANLSAMTALASTPSAEISSTLVVTDPTPSSTSSSRSTTPRPSASSSRSTTPQPSTPRPSTPVHEPVTSARESHPLFSDGTEISGQPLIVPAPRGRGHGRGRARGRGVAISNPPPAAAAPNTVQTRRSSRNK
ncbi:hypothetical protein VNI00_014301 [Paramarasmius palmivorus]|uniref:Uncharacterized protein n=1 Tax=Paramarasmius palmivorus TaxID=297713 RepID=A0AAW0BVK6_9AGAR